MGIELLLSEIVINFLSEFPYQLGEEKTVSNGPVTTAPASTTELETSLASETKSESETTPASATTTELEKI